LFTASDKEATENGTGETKLRVPAAGNRSLHSLHVYIHLYLQRENVLLPGNDCPGYQIYIRETKKISFTFSSSSNSYPES